MGILRNTRHEAFSQALAAGKTAGKAYEIAGFAPSYANASRLQRQDHIRRRVDDILDQKQRATDKAIESAAARAGVDEEWVLRNLRLNAVMAMRHGNRAAANRALELIGKHIGMFTERPQAAPPTEDDALEYLRQLDRRLGYAADDDKDGSSSAIN